MMPKQYQAVLVNLDPTIGSEIRKTRPCIILSPDEMNHHLQTVVVAPMTHGTRPYPTRMLVQHEGFDGWIAIDQIRTIDKQRIIKPLGELQPEEVLQLKSIIQETFVE